VGDQRDQSEELDGDGADDPSDQAWAGSTIVVMQVTGLDPCGFMHASTIRSLDQRRIIRSPYMCDR
jgi:hypothetical protein